MEIVRFFRKPVLSESASEALVKRFPFIGGAVTEYCYYIGLTAPLANNERDALVWLIRETFEPHMFSDKTMLPTGGTVLEVGPRLNFETPFSTNAVSVCRSVGISKVVRLERSRRYRFDKALSDIQLREIASGLHDRMTETVYERPLASFESGAKPKPVRVIPVIERGRDALRELNREMGLGLDDWDIEYYYKLFAEQMRRNPTDVECFDLGQSNSEHSRHWFFKGRIVIDGAEMPANLIDLVAAPWKKRPGNSVIAFGDNSSAIRGFVVKAISPDKPGVPSAMSERERHYHILFTAETHNFPSGVAPFPGAETGTGGRIRDVQGVGRGGHVIAGTAAYCVGNLRIPGYDLPWEDKGFTYPTNLASPLRIEIEASNGASDYGNKFGEPLIQGYTRAFGMRLPSGERREWLKPIMFTGGIGQMDDAHLRKGKPAKGMLLTKVGGPAYRIGIGGGAASSMVQGENVEELDFNAVQRGDAEMEQKMNRVIRAAIEMGADNPIVSIHDQGAGGNCNVLKELVEPEGARIDIRKIPLGDQTMSVLEIWGAEYQENNALLIKPERMGEFQALCGREKVPCAFPGEVTGDGRVVVTDGDSAPVDLDLKQVLGEMPRKTFDIKRIPPALKALDIPKSTTVREALDRVLRLVSVGSKRFLTSKVDRTVTGLIARQQCAGPLQLTVADVAVISQSHFPNSDGKFTGAATAIGEQPVKGLIEPGRMARLSVAEALTNIVWADLTAIDDIRCSGNWMWAAKLPGEGALIYDAAEAMSAFMTEVGVAVDGGKDSLSMAALDRASGEVVKAPGALVVSAYCTVPDITKTVTPDIKHAGKSALVYIDLGTGKRLGGSALAQCFGQLGDDCPDVCEPSKFKAALEVTQSLIKDGRVLAGHDVSDGGLIVTLLEMAFSGNCGIDADIAGDDPLATLFSEEPGIVMEVADAAGVIAAYKAKGVAAHWIGRTMADRRIKVSVGGKSALDDDMLPLRAIWEETSHQLERLQIDPACADEENKAIYDRPGPALKLTFTPSEPSKPAARHRVAIIREEGSNGDREMTAAFHAAGFEPWDITMSDLTEGRATLDQYRGVVFVGGFSYADVLDSAKGWAGTIRFHAKLRDMFRAFYRRPDTFSLGICNGCQLMALLGWVPWEGIDDAAQPRFVHNRAGRFESRFSTVRIEKSPAMMLRGMEGSVLGVWIAHGEGRALFPDNAIGERILIDGLVPVRYVDDTGNPTETYPLNPNGSPGGIAGLCSPDGRHLAMMPHPERAFRLWQWPWLPEDWRGLAASPWMRMFENARLWCDGR